MYGHGKTGYSRLSFVQQLQKIRLLFWPVGGFTNDGGVLIGSCLDVVQLILWHLAT
jgi:hypothetical protein